MKIKNNLKNIISIIYTFILCFSYVNLSSYAEPANSFGTSSAAAQSETKPSHSSTPSNKQHMSSKPSPSSSIPPKAETTKPSNKNIQSSSIPSTVKIQVPATAQNSQSTPPVEKKIEQSTSSSKKENEKKATAKNEVSNDESSTASETESSSSAPADLPTVDDDEIAFPEVVAASSIQEAKKTNSWAGIIAWICILAGIAIVIFVIINGRKSGEVPVQISSSKPKTKKKKRLLPSEYYRDKF